MRSTACGRFGGAAGATRAAVALALVIALARDGALPPSLSVRAAGAARIATTSSSAAAAAASTASETSNGSICGGAENVPSFGKDLAMDVDDPGAARPDDACVPMDVVRRRGFYEAQSCF